MKINPKLWDTSRLQIAITVQILLLGLALGSVLPRPNIKPRSTTQITNIDKDYTGEGTIVIVTSSELPKQIPPPPTPTKPHRPTPRYEVTSPAKELLYKNGLHDKDIFASFHVPYAFNHPNVFRSLQ